MLAEVRLRTNFEEPLHPGLNLAKAEIAAK